MKKWLALILCLVLLSGSIAFAAETPVTVTYSYGDIDLAVGTATSVRVNVAPYVAKKKGVTYATSDESIATVTSKGRLTGIAEGDCQLIVTSVYDTTVSATIPVHIVIPVDTLTLTAPENTVPVGGTLQLSVAYSPENATQKSAAFSSANSSVASVSPTGLVTGLKRGTAVITAISSDGEAKATLKVTVSQPVQSVTVTPTDGKAAVGRKIQLKANVAPTNANNKSVDWTSDNESIAVVNSKGTVTVKGVGSATITATSSDNTTVSGSVTVQGVQLAQSVAFDSSLYAVIINQTGQVHVNVLPESTSDKSVTYKVGNSRIATVDMDGVITALKGGKTTVTATAADGSKKKASATIQVLVPVTGVSYKYKDVRVGVKSRNTYTVSIQPSNATNKNMTWVSSDESIATVSGTTNRFSVRGLRWGRCKVTGTTEDGGFTIEVNVDVGTLAKAITVLDVTIKNGKPYLSLRNASDMNISQIRYRLMGYDATFQPVKMSTKGNLYILDGTYDFPLAQGEITEHGQFNFYNHSNYANLAILQMCITGWSSDTGYYDSNGELRTSYNLSEDKWVWITYPTDTNLDLLK